LAGSKAFISQKRSFFAICDISGYDRVKLDYWTRMAKYSSYHFMHYGLGKIEKSLDF